MMTSRLELASGGCRVISAGSETASLRVLWWWRHADAAGARAGRRRCSHGGRGPL